MDLDNKRTFLALAHTWVNLMGDRLRPPPKDSPSESISAELMRACDITAVLGEAHEIPDQVFDQAKSSRMAQYCHEYMAWRFRSVLGESPALSPRPKWLPVET
jgi:hypothetical protein